MKLFTAVYMGMIITNLWKLFFWGVKRDHYEKLIGIREFLERLALDFFNNNFTANTGAQAKNITLLEEVDDRETVCTYCSINLSSSDSLSTQGSTISDLFLNIVSSLASNLAASTIGS